MAATPDLNATLAARRGEDRLARYLPARAGCALFFWRRKTDFFLRGEERRMRGCEGRGERRCLRPDLFSRGERKKTILPGSPLGPFSQLIPEFVTGAAARYV